MRERSHRLGGLTLMGVSAALVVAYVPLGFSTHDFFDGFQVLFALAACVPGLVLAFRRPRNPIGWLFAIAGVDLMFYTDAGRYSFLDYHLHHGSLPLGPVAVVTASDLWLTVFMVMPLPILLFPEGHLSARWRTVLCLYGVASVIALIAVVDPTIATMSTSRVLVDADGQLSSPGAQGSGDPPNFVITIGWFCLLSCPAFWASFVARQVASWHNADGARREQLKWLMTGAGISVLALVGVFVFAQSSGPLYGALDATCLLFVFALPVSISVAVLKYRLYEIDRLVSRALGYFLTTALVIGLFVGLVSLADSAIGSTSAWAVATSTLAAAALFNPLRRYLQRRVDRRFNRARYDAEALVATFASTLRETVDAGLVQRSLLETVQNAVEPVSASLWVPRG